MERFLNDETVRSSGIRARRLERLACALAGLEIVFFISVCLLTRTGNARAMLFLAAGSAILSGWGIAALWMFALEPARAEERHLTGLAGLEPEIREGRFFMTGDSFRIPRSVRIRKARLETETESLSLNVNERLADRMPPDGSLVRAETARKFITGIEILTAGTPENARPGTAPARRIIRALGRFILPGVLWAMLALLFTGFVFNGITDTDPANKIVIYADCEVQNAPQLAEKLENALDGAVRMVKIHPFHYAMFDSLRLKQADLFIIPDSRKEEYREWLSDAEGLTVYDPETGTAVFPDVFRYTREPYRLYPGSASVHLEDGLAKETAALLLTLTTE